MRDFDELNQGCSEQTDFAQAVQTTEEQRHPMLLDALDQDQPPKIDHAARTSAGQTDAPLVGACAAQAGADLHIMGTTCSRGCLYCNVTTENPDTLKPLDVFEPARVARAVENLGLTHVCLSTVNRDDVFDGGAAHIARTIHAVRRANPETTIEVLAPDFLNCQPSALHTVLHARPDIFNHPLQTVPGLYPKLKPGARYFHSLCLLERVKEHAPEILTKSGILVGLGEDFPAVLQVIDDLRAIEIDILNIGQYDAAGSAQHPVERHLRPGEFASFERIALGKGFREVCVSPLIRPGDQAGPERSGINAGHRAQARFDR